MRYITKLNRKVRQGTAIEDPISKYGVYFGSIRVLNIPDYFRDSKGIGEGICKVLNTGKIILPLEI